MNSVELSSEMTNNNNNRLVAEMKEMIAGLSIQINIEEEKAGIHDVNHGEYPHFARCARKRRSRLLKSVAALTT